MSGGPQVFLGATTLLCGCCAARFPAAARALGWGRAAWCARGRRPAHVHRSQAPQAPRRPPIGRPSFSAMSHVIPLHVFQTLKTYRWNCNVLSGARKLTPGNNVRLLYGFGFGRGLVIPRRNPARLRCRAGFVVGTGQAFDRFTSATSTQAPINAAMTVGRIQPSWFAWSGLHMSAELMCSV